MSIVNSSCLHQVLDALEDGVFIADGEGVVLYLNRAYERITGLGRAQIVGSHVSELVSQGVISRSVSLLVIKERQPVTVTQTIHNGRQILVSGNPMFADDGTLECVVTNVRDVTELLRAKHAEEQLAQWVTTRRQYGVDTSECGLSDGLLISPKSKKCYDLARRIASRPVKVLIQGETGTGKSQLARYIHRNSDRADQPFMELNCAAMPEGLLESELFGYRKGAFSGASTKGKRGLLEVANGGTLFLDEIGDLPLSLQAKLLKVVEDNVFLPVGGTAFQSVDIRLITASHKDLKQAVAEGAFRQDLYYRICVIAIVLPPLAQRREEVLPLLNHYLSHFGQVHRLDKMLHPEAREMLMQYHWPGNIRELANLCEYLVLTSEFREIRACEIPETIVAHRSISAPLTGGTLKEQVESLEKYLIESALSIHKTTRKAARALGVEQSTLVKKYQRINGRGTSYLEQHHVMEGNAES